MLNKGLQKGYIDLLSRWSYDFFARCPISLFIPRAKYPHHGVRAKPGEGWSLKTNDAAFPLKDCLIKMAAVFIPPSNQ